MLNNTDVRIPNILTVSSWLQLPNEITVVINTTFYHKNTNSPMGAEKMHKSSPF
jgi:hypothetical protein